MIQENASAPSFELIDAFKEKYSEYEIIEYPDSEGIPWKYYVDTDGYEIELIFGEERTILRSYDADDDDLICIVVNPFSKDIWSSCPPKW